MYYNLYVYYNYYNNYNNYYNNTKIIFLLNFII